MGVAHRRGFSRWLKPLLADKARLMAKLPSGMAKVQNGDTEAEMAEKTPPCTC